METTEKKDKSNEVANVITQALRIGSAYDVKRFNGAVKALLETDLLNEEQRTGLERVAEAVQMKYLKG